MLSLKCNDIYSHSFSLCIFSHTQWVVWAMRTSTSHPSLPPPCQTTCCPPTSHMIPPLDRTTLWTTPPAQLHTTPTRCRVWICPACPVTKIELVWWTKMEAHSALMVAQWPALCLWWVINHSHTLCTWYICFINDGLQSHLKVWFLHMMFTYMTSIHSSG